MYTCTNLVLTHTPSNEHALPIYSSVQLHRRLPTPASDMVRNACAAPRQALCMKAHIGGHVEVPGGQQTAAVSSHSHVKRPLTIFPAHPATPLYRRQALKTAEANENTSARKSSTRPGRGLHAEGARRRRAVRALRARVCWCANLKVCSQDHRRTPHHKNDADHIQTCVPR